MSKVHQGAGKTSSTGKVKKEAINVGGMWGKREKQVRLKVGDGSMIDGHIRLGKDGNRSKEAGLESYRVSLCMFS